MARSLEECLRAHEQQTAQLADRGAKFKLFGTVAAALAIPALIDASRMPLSLQTGLDVVAGRVLGTVGVVSIALLTESSPKLRFSRLGLPVLPTPQLPTEALIQESAVWFAPALGYAA